MASRNNGEGPPNGKGSGGGPGSYVKIAGSRRRRRGRKQVPSTRPSSPTALAEPLEADASAGEPSGESHLDEPFDPPVDDLRAQRAAPSAGSPGWRPPGPLGLDEARATHGASQPASSVAHVRVVEINAPPRASDNSNDGLPGPEYDDALTDAGRALPVEPRLANLPAAFDEPFAAPSVPPPAASDEGSFADEDRFADDAELRAASEPPPSHPSEEPSGDPEPVPAAMLVGQQPFHGFVIEGQDGEVESEGQHAFSTVFNARPSLRPSPPPPPQSAVGWWVAIALLSSIIGAAGLVAWREHQEELQQPRAVSTQREPPAAGATPASRPHAADLRARATPPPALMLPDPIAAVAPALPAASDALDAGARAAADAAVAAPKPARVWKPRKQVAGDAGALGARPGAPAEPQPIESVPANPYGTTPGIR